MIWWVRKIQSAKYSISRKWVHASRLCKQLLYIFIGRHWRCDTLTQWKVVGIHVLVFRLLLYFESYERKIQKLKYIHPLILLDYLQQYIYNEDKPLPIWVIQFMFYILILYHHQINILLIHYSYLVQTAITVNHRALKRRGVMWTFLYNCAHLFTPQNNLCSTNKPGWLISTAGVAAEV